MTVIAQRPTGHTCSNIGYQLGWERAQLDQESGFDHDPSQIWVPRSASNDYRAALRQGYADGKAGKVQSPGDL